MDDKTFDRLQVNLKSSFLLHLDTAPPGMTMEEIVAVYGRFVYDICSGAGMSEDRCIVMLDLAADCVIELLDFMKSLNQMPERAN